MPRDVASALDRASSRTIVLLFAVCLFNYLDRQVLLVLAEPIKHDLSLSDTQLGLLGGLAFAAVYSILGIPLAMLADRWSPKWVLTASLGVWSLMSAAGGLAANFGQLIATRAGVAGGEAGCMPAAHALISAGVPERRRGIAMGVFSLGVPIGGMLGMVLGGYLSGIIGWRGALVVVGLPGVLLCLVCAVLLPDARQARAETSNAPVRRAMAGLMSQPAYRHLWIGLTLQGVAVWSFYAFCTPFLVRTHNLSVAQAGLGVGLVTGAAGAAGVLLGGWLVDRIGPRRYDRALWAPMAGFALAAPLSIATCLVPQAWLAIALIGLIQFVAVIYLPSCYAVAQRLAPPANRAISSALLLLGINLIGGCLGPLLTGGLSDLMFSRFGSASLRYALCIATLPYLWAALHLMLAKWQIARGLAAAGDENA